MHSSFNSSYFAQLHRYMQWQTDRIRQLEQKVDLLEKRLEALKQQRAITVEKIEYNFDQLKVEKLEGSMSIGLSPSGLGNQSVEELAVGGQVIHTNTSRSESYERIQNIVLTYLEADCPDELSELENKYSIKLDEDLREKIIADLQNQAGLRIEHYMDTLMKGPQHILTPDDEQEIARRVIEDIRAGVEQFVSNYKPKGKE